MKNPENIAVISRSWEDLQLFKFLRGLKRNDTFGFSHSFSIDEMTSIALSNGVRVRPLPKNHPYYKKYGKWMLKVTSVQSFPETIHDPKNFIDNLKVEKIRNEKICDICKGAISKNTKVLTSYSSKNQRKAMNKKYYCISCGLKSLTKSMNNIIVLLKVLS